MFWVRGLGWELVYNDIYGVGIKPENLKSYLPPPLLPFGVITLPYRTIIIQRGSPISNSRGFHFVSVLRGSWCCPLTAAGGGPNGTADTPYGSMRNWLFVNMIMTPLCKRSINCPTRISTEQKREFLGQDFAQEIANFFWVDKK